ncbi:hypothetical protein [Sphingomonas sp. PvP018]|uniref:hypothetical protein n=1 Tax=Sphingomonas sp. PvP018 TaxID=2817852 RepID=UPI001AE5F1F4|nr:hypothetical protein [Sphingomonas sp. PvP018]MBP2513846.1 hypothetical protein [Sphingomonas sp. PvP018]
MNDPKCPQTDQADWKAAIAAVNAWRGLALQSFASAEQSVSETLLLLSDLPERGTRIALRHLVGQRFQDLEDALSTGGPFGDEGAVALAAVTAFRRHEHLRTVLAHGVAKIALDRQGRWVVVMRVLTFRGRQAERAVRVFEQIEAEALCEEIRLTAQRLCSTLSNLRSVLRQSLSTGLTSRLRNSASRDLIDPSPASVTTLGSHPARRHVRLVNCDPDY